MLIHHCFLVLLLWIYSPVSAYYGDPSNSNNALPPISLNAFVSLGNSIYSLGGSVVNDSGTETMVDVMEYTFDSSQNVQQRRILSKNATAYRDCTNCQGYALPDNKTIVVVGVKYPIPNSDNTKLGLGFYDTQTNSWTYPDIGYTDAVPFTRYYFSSAISPEGDALYVIGGEVNETYNTTYNFGIIKYDLLNRTSVIDMSIEDPDMRLDVDGSCAIMLPNGNIVIGLGIHWDGEAYYKPHHITLFDTKTNKIYIQPVSGAKLPGRVDSSCVLGPDKSTIYFFGGGDRDNHYNPLTGKLYNDLLILDTKTWSWIDAPPAGKLPSSSKRPGMTNFGSNKIIISPANAFTFTSTSLSVVINVPGIGDDIKSSNLRWFTNFEPYDNPQHKSYLSDGGKAGIIVAVLVVVTLLFTLLWKYVPATRRIATYVQQDMIWSPRSGEPLWAETTRLLVRFILLVLFLAFVSYVIYRSVESPISSQRIEVKVDSVLAPDIRFCFDGFQSNKTNPKTLNPSVSCNFRNGTSCSEHIYPLDKSLYTPVYNDNFGEISCFLFLPSPDFRIMNDVNGYLDALGTKAVFTLFANPMYDNNLDWGVVYVDFYAPGYDYNVHVFQLGTTKFSRDEIMAWRISEQASNLVKTTILKQGVRSATSYSLTKVQKLRKDDGWNYIGFSSTYDESMTVVNNYVDPPQNAENMNISYPYTKRIAELTVLPEAFIETTMKEQKVFTLLNAFAQVGGVLGLFIAVQTLLFGFRPQSPWGIVHRWSFGNLRIRLTDRLAYYFNRTGTPVPLVNPVHNDPNLHQYFRNNDTYIPHGPDVPSASDDQIETTVVQENRVKRVEERLQLMELLLKSYYLNDEVFRSLDQAVKRKNEEKRRSSMIQVNDRETDSVLGNDALNEEYGGDNNGVSNVKRRPSSTVFEMRQRGQYEPNLTPEAPLELYDEESEIGKR
ncbi:uncharacterized protein EV154DRAFT_505361 [Mucor mucedo]|uniref:uncharacterized protein n=1 Tax=Mucor mucedo TaxID=29922 RepID=UPI002220529C|nr:uncharacterized protein EV154DRAFT_505361 [Mucor mucedo]KAI7892262.1 hypothetical protein EV154DRAFT_505361 [Mucor mucedo]